MQDFDMITKEQTKPFFYYCEIDTNVENFNLKSVKIILD